MCYYCDKKIDEIKTDILWDMDILPLPTKVCDAHNSQILYWMKNYTTFYTGCGGSIDMGKKFINYDTILNLKNNKSIVVYRGIYGEFDTAVYHKHISCWTTDIDIAKQCGDTILSTTLEENDPRVLIDTRNPNVDFKINHLFEKCIILKPGLYYKIEKLNTH